MEDIFINILNMSITASYFALAVIILKGIFRKIPKWISCILWGLVGLRLILPFSFESILSLIPVTQTIPSDIIMSREPHITSGIPMLNSVVNPIISESFTPDPSYSVNPLQVITFILSVLWLTGIGAMLIYTAVSYYLLRKKTLPSIKNEDGTYICDLIDTPFISGIINPKIYLPSTVNEEDKSLIIAHEKAHIKRGDHLWKPLGFLLLSVYWFNPVLWIAYILLCRDIEAACDERVLRDMDTAEKKRYSEVLISCSAPKKIITACPLAFGETGVKSRIKNILSYKKPALWIIITALILSFVLSVCFISDPKSTRINDLDGYGDFFKGVTKIQLFTKNYVYTTEDPSDELRLIKKIKLEELSDGENAEITDSAYYSIEINDSKSVYIDKSLSYLSTAKNGASTKVYRIKNPEMPKKLFSEKTFAIQGENTSEIITDSDGIYITIGSDGIKEYDDKTSFEVTWHNETKNEVTYGEMFSVEKFTDGEWVKVPFPENFVFTTIGYLLPPRSTKTITYTYPGRLSANEFHRISVSFSVEPYGTDKNYTTRSLFVSGSTGDITYIGGEDGPVEVIVSKKLTLEDVLRLSEKGDSLSWDDFREYSYVETGSGLYIRSYDIDERFSVIIGATAEDNTPLYFYLHAPNTYSDAHIDIRNGSEAVKEYIETNKQFSIVKKLSYAQRGFQLDGTEDIFSRFMKYDGCYIPLGMSMSSIEHYPTIKIESKKELDAFNEYFSSELHLCRDKNEGLPFSEVCKLYDTEYEDFFKDNILLITYATAANSHNLLSVDSISLSDTTLSISINETSDKKHESSHLQTRWLMVMEISREQFSATEHISAYKNPYSGSEAFVTETYTFSQSEIEVTKPHFTLYSDGSFSFVFHPAVSYIGFGTYTRDENGLTLTCDDGNIYHFTEKNGAYAFDAESSCDKLYMSDIKDGSIFRY